jgi:hypothetical protein
MYKFLTRKENIKINSLAEIYFVGMILEINKFSILKGGKTGIR